METIKASELRIGNYVMDRGGKILLIDHWEYENKISEKIVDGLHPFTEFVEYLQPIQLTEEWLLKFGAKELANPKRGVFKEFVLKTVRIEISHNGNFYYKNSKLILEHVHDLQNLYFALRKEELLLSLD